MAERKNTTASEATVETTETVKVQGVVEKPAPEPKPAPTEPEQAAKPATGTEEVVANIGHVRIRTAAEKRATEEAGTKEDHWLRPAKEAHADAARVSVVAAAGNEFAVSDLKGIDPEGAGTLARVRLLFDWNDGQGVFHGRGKELDLLRNEAAKLVEQGLAERVNPPAVEPIEQAVTDATIKALSGK